MMMTDQPTCEDRIEDELRSRLDDLREMFEKIDHAEGDEQEEAQDELDTLPLSVEPVRQVRIVLSTGGPHDEFLATLDEDGSVARVEYVFQDWFDGARRNLGGGSDFELASRLVEYFAEVVNWSQDQ